MFERIYVKKALNRTWALDTNPGSVSVKPSDSQGSVTSQLIYDIFGGEILKTPEKKSWHFYNRIDGERIDITGSEKSELSRENHFEDLPSNSAETQTYFEEEDYSSFFIKFIRAYEEAVGLDK
jgi:hypothetical protein